ncbi:unnamed protein product, partial [Iphiclides podalirius]
MLVMLREQKKASLPALRLLDSSNRKNTLFLQRIRQARGSRGRMLHAPHSHSSILASYIAPGSKAMPFVPRVV